MRGPPAGGVEAGAVLSPTACGSRPYGRADSPVNASTHHGPAPAAQPHTVSDLSTAARGTLRDRGHACRVMPPHTERGRAAPCRAESCGPVPGEDRRERLPVE